ncbi:peptidoglycan-associated lipoprotein Pal [Polymorphobacter sp. PAMC 29334]|uniref:peptidoglycan-associated lipoprotein Pal n=1 Tax=Polymorphobacter sp. PAMC 29334 TaxID=2862331 RepID=UPI001C78110E|nr:peptidoglycan-associated lipoprotein Pal [Polymorphobacter sp. PAMC 29334]QYE34868.1 peptidoglycan-associated lipoprotein Pal [Polymorphobacter sp. PAMC 29334]
MLHRASTLAIVAVLVGTAACSTKKKVLPPPPPPATAPMAPTMAPPSTSGSGDTGVGTTNLPGSIADFKATSGSDTVLFAYDSYDVDDTAKAVLGKQAEWLARYPSVKVTVEGHTDERGTREYNLALGDRRASAAKNFLAAQGVNSSRIATISYGKERPVADGTDEAAYAQNRRAVTVVVSGAR